MYGTEHRESIRYGMITYDMASRGNLAQVVVVVVVVGVLLLQHVQKHENDALLPSCRMVVVYLSVHHQDSRSYCFAATNINLSIVIP